MSKIDLSPAKLDLRGLPAGDDVSITLDFGTDTTGALISAQVRETASADTVELSGVVSEIDASLGQWSVLFSGTDTRTVLADASRWQGVWDLEITLAGQANPRTILAGRFEIELDVTRV